MKGSEIRVNFVHGNGVDIIFGDKWKIISVNYTEETEQRVVFYKIPLYIRHKKHMNFSAEYKSFWNGRLRQ